MCNRDVGYNILPTAGNRLGCKTTNETKEKLRQASIKNGNKPPSNKGKKHTKETKKKMSKSQNKKPVINISTGEIFKSLSKASLKYNINIGNLSECCNNKRKTCGGYKWAYQ